MQAMQGLQGCKAAGLQGFRAARLQVCWAFSERPFPTGHSQTMHFTNTTALVDTVFCGHMGRQRWFFGARSVNLNNSTLLVRPPFPTDPPKPCFCATLRHFSACTSKLEQHYGVLERPHTSIFTLWPKMGSILGPPFSLYRSLGSFAAGRFRQK